MLIGIEETLRNHGLEQDTCGLWEPHRHSALDVYWVDNGGLDLWVAFRDDARDRSRRSAQFSVADEISCACGDG